jgi:uncharacterized protein YjcR
MTEGEREKKKKNSPPHNLIKTKRPPSEPAQNSTHTHAHTIIYEREERERKKKLLKTNNILKHANTSSERERETWGPCDRPA